MHSLIEIGKEVLDKKRPLKTICKYYFIISVLLPPPPLSEEHRPSFEQIEGCGDMN